MRYKNWVFTAITLFIISLAGGLVTPTNLANLTLTAPADGYVHLTLTALARTGGDSTAVILGLGTISTPPTYTIHMLE